MADKWSSPQFTAALVADINAAASSVMGIGATVTSNFKLSFGNLATWLATVGFVATTLTAAGFVGPLTGNATTATALQTARTINGVSFNGTAGITVVAAAGTLTGATLAANVLASSLTSVGTLASLAVAGATTLSSTLAVTGTLSVTGTTSLTGNVGVGGVSDSSVGVYVSGSPMLTASQIAAQFTPTWTSAATGAGYGIITRITTAAAAFTMLFGYGVYVNTPVLGAGSSITSNTGLFVSSQGAAGITNAIGVDIAAQSGAATLNIGLRNAGTSVLTGAVTTGASVTTGSAIAITAGGSLVGHAVSSTANFGLFVGSGAPTISAAQGSIYLRSDGSTVATRVYVATSSAGAWTAITTAT